MSDTSKAKTTPTRSVARPKVPPFARFRGTSVWRKDRVRAREYAKFLAAQKAAKSTATPKA